MIVKKLRKKIECTLCDNKAAFSYKNKKEIYLCDSCFRKLNHNKTTFYANDRFETKCLTHAIDMFLAIKDISNEFRSWRKHCDYNNPEEFEDRVLDIIKEFNWEC